MEIDMDVDDSGSNLDNVEPTFSQLPMDLVLQILYFVSWRDVLAVGEVCFSKRLSIICLSLGVIRLVVHCTTYRRHLRYGYTH